MDEDEISFVATPASDAGCHIGLPFQRMFFQNDAGKNTNKHLRNNITYDEFDNKREHEERKKILQAHQPDIPQRCIVDQSETKRVVWLQSDELLRRQGLLKMNGMWVDKLQSQQILPIDENQNGVGSSIIGNENDEDDDDRKSMFSEPSILSSITSASNTTVVRKNTKTKSKNEKKIRGTSNGPGSIYRSTYAALSPPPSNISNIIEEENNKSNSNKDSRRPDSSEMGPIKKQLTCPRAKLYRNKKALNTNRVAISKHLSIPNHHASGKDLERHQRLSVLQLKMKANIGWFYTQRYLMMFPNELQPIVGTVPRNEGEIPELTCEYSDISFSSSCSSSSDHTDCIDYGSMPPITPVKCPVTNESFLDLAITGCLGLVPREQDYKALRPCRRQLIHHYEKSPDHCIVLMNKRSGCPLAVCAMKATSGSPVVRIYATRQMAFAQKPTATTRQLGLDWADDLPLYAWAEFHSEGDFPDKMNFTIFMVKRFDGCFSSQPSYKASFDGHATDDNGVVRSHVIEMAGRTDSERNMSGCALISIRADEMMTRSHSENVPNLSFYIDLAQGIDPAFLICFTAIVDEIIEKSMRMRCQNLTRGLIRKDSFSLTKKRLEARPRMTFDKRMTDVLPCKADFCTYGQCNFVDKEIVD